MCGVCSLVSSRITAVLSFVSFILSWRLATSQFFIIEELAKLCFILRPALGVVSCKGSKIEVLQSGA